MSNPHKQECLEIKKLCEKYGYGNVMEWASALWRHDYIKKGYGDSIGACFVPTCPDFIKEEFRTDHRIYDVMVQEILSEDEKE